MGILALFIGGAADGTIEMVKSPPPDSIEVPIVEGSAWSYIPIGHPDAEYVKKELYTLKRLRGEKRLHVLYAVAGMTIDEALEKLFFQYADR